MEFLNKEKANKIKEMIIFFFICEFFNSVYIIEIFEFFYFFIEFRISGKLRINTFKQFNIHSIGASLSILNKPLFLPFFIARCIL